MRIHQSKTIKYTTCRRCSKGPKSSRKTSFKIKDNYCVSCRYGISSKRKHILKKRKHTSKIVRLRRGQISFLKGQFNNSKFSFDLLYR